MQENRGLVVQQGGTKALLSLAAEGTEKGKTVAAQALARIAITINPEVAFPGQRVGVGDTQVFFFSSVNWGVYFLVIIIELFMVEVTLCQRDIT